MNIHEQEAVTGKSPVPLSPSPRRPPVYQEWPPAGGSLSQGLLAEHQCLLLHTPRTAALWNGMRIYGPRSKFVMLVPLWGPG